MKEMKEIATGGEPHTMLVLAPKMAQSHKVLGSSPHTWTLPTPATVTKIEFQIKNGVPHITFHED